MVQMFVRTVVRMRVIALYTLLFISILLNIFCPYFSILLDFIFFLCYSDSFFVSLTPYLCFNTPIEWRYFNVSSWSVLVQLAYQYWDVYSDSYQPVRQSA